MFPRDRLMATLRGEAVDRPAVSFYEINGLDEDPANPDPFNIYTDPSWRPLIQLAGERTDRIVMRGVPFRDAPPDPLQELGQEETVIRSGSRLVTRTISIGPHTLTTRTRQDQDLNTVWTEEHLLKDVDDLRAFLQIPEHEFGGTPDITSVVEAEKNLGDSGIVMLDTYDPLCLAAALFEMGQYTLIAMTEPKLFHQLLERFSALLHCRTQAISEALPGRLWRIYGPEYASPPYLPPALFREYVCHYDKPMVQAIQAHGGFARMHSHGNLKEILDDIVSLEADGLDPIEPPPQGDVELRYVRERYGEQLVLFGNLEVSDIEHMPTPQFTEKVKTALDEGTSGHGRGFVLMPSACPYGRGLSELSLANYTKIVELVEAF